MVNRVRATLANIRADSRDISFYFKKKKGVARLSDYGTTDIIVPDRGISINMVLVTGEEDAADVTGRTDRMFRIERADAEVHDMKVSLRATKHDLLFKVLNPIITRQVKKAVERALSERLRMLLVTIDEQVTIIARQAAETSTEVSRGLRESAVEARRNFKERAKRSLQQQQEMMRSVRGDSSTAPATAEAAAAVTARGGGTMVGGDTMESRRGRDTGDIDDTGDRPDTRETLDSPQPSANVSQSPLPAKKDRGGRFEQGIIYEM